MSDPEASTPTTSKRRAPEVCDEIGRSLGAVWQRHAGSRPTTINTEINGDVIKCVMEGAARETDADADGEAARSPESRDYDREAIAAVTKATRRRVLGFVPKHDAKREVATDTFILESRHVSN